jgi:protoporphyrinogen oxidase
VSRGPIVIIGGGLAALMTAHFLRLRGESGEILVVERAAEVGGLLRAVDGGEWGLFDQGMHTFTSALIPELDEVVFGMLPHDEWVWLRDEVRDISGVVFEGRLQKESHYPDLRLLPSPLRERAVADFFLSLDARVPEGPPADMEEYARRRFGPVIAREVVSPILEKLYGRPARLIDPAVAVLLPLDRVTLFDEPTFRALMENDLLRARIAYPEQRRLPLRYASGRYSVYPKAFGAWRLVDAVVKKLQAAGVRILTRTELSGLERAGSRISRISLRGPGGVTTVDEPADVYWTAGVTALAKALGLPSGAAPFEAPKIPAVVNLLIDHPPRLDDLYYFWGFDPNFRSFRVTNFTSYSPGAPRRGGWPIALEFFLGPEEPRDEAALVALALRELGALGAVDERTRVLFHAGHALPVGFPILSLANRRTLEATRGEILEQDLRNLAITGIQSEWGVVFQPDVLAHAWRTVHARTGGAA